MAEYTYEDLKDKTVAELREIASGIEHEAVVGHSQMHKDELVHAVATALGIEEATHTKVVGVDKSALKREIKELRQQRDQLLGGDDQAGLKRVRRRMHRLKRRIRRNTIKTG